MRSSIGRNISRLAGFTSVLAVGALLAPAAQAVNGNCDDTDPQNLICNSSHSSTIVEEGAPLTSITFVQGFSWTSASGNVAEVTNSGAGPLTVTAQGYFEAQTSSGGSTLFVSNGTVNVHTPTDLTIVQEATSTITADVTGIQATNFGTGDTTITTSGDVTGNGTAFEQGGILAFNAPAAGDLTVTQLAGSIAGGWMGVYVWNQGTGATSVTASGSVSATGSQGIYATNDETATALTVTGKDGSTISGGDYGVNVDNYGSGATTITLAGAVTGSNGDGMRAYNGSGATDLTISQTAGSIQGLNYGINTRNDGTGASTITTAGDVTGTTDRGVFNYNGTGAGDLTITQLSGTITGGLYGIQTTNFGISDTIITTSGDVTGHGTGDDQGGIVAINAKAARDLTVTQLAGSISGGWAGIDVWNQGTGTTVVTVSGTVSATGDRGIYVTNDETATNLSVTGNAGSSISGGDYGIKVDNFGTGATSVTLAGEATGNNLDGIRAYNAGTTTDLTVSQTAGSIQGKNYGINTRNDGVGATTITTYGTVHGGESAISATSFNGDGFTIDVRAGHLSAGEGSPGVIQTYAPMGGTVDIEAGAAVDAGDHDAIALHDGDGYGDTADDVGGDMVVTTAGTVRGTAILGAGNDTFKLTGGTWSGNIYGDGVTAADNDGDDHFEWSGGDLNSGFYGQNGSDTAIISANAHYEGTEILDGGDDRSIQDGWIDTLTLQGVTATAKGSTIINWEKVILDGADLTISDGAWAVGTAGEPTTGLTLVNGAVLNGGANLAFDGNIGVGAGTAVKLFGGGAGVYSISGSLTNAGTVTMQDGKAGDVLAVGGDYVGQGGVLAFDTGLMGDSSIADKLVIGGDTSGTGTVKIANVGGTGVQTADGLKIIDIAGASDATFTLDGDYVYHGRPWAIAGAYGYGLYKGGVSTPNDGDWYLRSTYQPGVAVYQAYQKTLLSLNGLSTLQERLGNRFWSGAGAGVAAQGADAVDEPAEPTTPDATQLGEGRGIWARIDGGQTSLEASGSDEPSNLDIRMLRGEAGIDLPLSEKANGTLVGGLSVRYGHASADAGAAYGSGKVSTDGYGAAASLTWYDARGFYVDAQASAMWYDSDLSSDLFGALARGNDGTGYAASVEAGKRIALSAPGWSITPQAQLSWSSVGFDAFDQTLGGNTVAHIAGLDGDSLTGRLGVTLDREASWQAENGTLSRSHVYGLTEISYDFLDDTSVNVSGSTVTLANQQTWAGIGLGGSLTWNDDRYSVYGTGTARTGVEDFGKSTEFGGSAGFKVNW